MDPYSVVRDFEAAIASFVGSRYAVAVDSCTNALFLCCTYLQVTEVEIPARTYVSVPCAIIHAGGRVKFRKSGWIGRYQLRPYPIYDSACQLSRNTYQPGAYQCLSFSANKPLNIGKGGMICHDDPAADGWFRRARYEGRHEVPLLQDTFDMLGWNMYMTPEQASRGLVLATYLKDTQVVRPTYPDLSQYKIYQAER